MRPSPTIAGDVVLVLDAGTDAGHRLARELLDSGHRVAITARHASTLTRSLHGYRADKVYAVAADTADPEQARRLLEMIEYRLGSIDTIVCASCGSDCHTRRRLKALLSAVPGRVCA